MIASVRASDWIVVLALAVAIAAVYAPVRQFAFLKWDDQLYVTENAHVRAGLVWHGVVWAFTTATSPYWHPLTWLSHIADVQVFGITPSGPHVVNVVLHLLTTILVFAFFRRTTGRPWASAFVAGIFGVHPLHVESVAWIAERKDVLSGFFALLTLHAYVSYARRPTAGRYALVFAAFLCALMSKPMVVTLPAVLLLADIWPLQRVPHDRARVPAAWLWRDKLPLFALGAAIGAATVIIQGRVGAIGGLHLFPLAVRIENATVSYLRYVADALWPTSLAAFYPYHWSMPVWQPIVAACALMAITALVIWRARAQPYLFVGWLWFAIMLLPVSGLLQSGEQARADRFMYLPLVGLAVMAAWGAADALGRGRPGRLALAVGATAAVAGAAFAAHAQVGTWRDDVTVWTHAIAVTRENYLAHDLLGLALKERQQWEPALAEYDAAIRYAPPAAPDFVALVENNIGYVLVQQRKIPQALAHYAQALRLKPAFPETFNDIGAALMMQGKAAEAISYYTTAIDMNPSLADAQKGLGGALVRHGDAAAAIPHFEEAVRLSPAFADAYNDLGVALSMEGRGDEAISRFREAVRLEPANALAHMNLAMALSRAGQTAEAVDVLTRAINLDPGQPVWHYNLAVLLADDGRMREAADQLEQALDLDPTFAPARDALGTLPRALRRQ